MLDDRSGPPPFLTTHRALSVATREFARFGDSLTDGVASVFGQETERQPRVRRSPERCIVQVGRSAATIAWLRDRPDTGEGELLIIYWRGTVAPAINQHFERARELTLSATSLGESVFFAEATSEADWRWRSRDEPVLYYSSSSLAAVVVERLRTIHETAGIQATG